MTLTLTYDLYLQSSAIYGHGLLTCGSSRLAVSHFRRKSGNKRTDGQTDRQTETNALPAALMLSVKMQETISMRVISISETLLLCVRRGDALLTNFAPMQRRLHGA